MQIESLQQQDIEAAANLIATVFSERWREPALKEFRRLFAGEQHPTYIFVAKDGDQIIGTAGCMEQYFSENIYGICWVGVLESHRSQGLATKLITAAENFAMQDLAEGKPCTLLLTTDKSDLYHKLGYSEHSLPVHDGGKMMLKISNK